ncbi:MAG: hypothetical protein BGO98_45010 [Myxococcales bacterium 68-20]|nr:MAG: hypothetical protein BGO98_45010 [Myxococcales bacterium 68-20]
MRLIRRRFRQERCACALTELGARDVRWPLAFVVESFCFGSFLDGSRSFGSRPWAQQGRPCTASVGGFA